MRVVAGSLRGRRLAAPPDDRARPTSDRVREAIFNALGSIGGVEGDRVLDLFAGTGALGIEALSRGAAHVTFVEQHRPMTEVLRRNLDHLGLTEQSTVVPGTAEAFLASCPVGTSFDLALLDPPYAFDGWPALLAALPAGSAVIESDRPPELSPSWGVARQKRYGSTLVTFIERTRPADPPGVDPSAPGGSQ